MISGPTISKAREQAARTLWDIPAAAKADPQSSHRAASDITRSGLRNEGAARAAHCVSVCPGCTYNELAKQFSADKHSLMKRLNDARALGLVRNGDQRKCRISGRVISTWYPCETGGKSDCETDA